MTTLTTTEFRQTEASSTVPRKQQSKRQRDDAAAVAAQRSREHNAAQQNPVNYMLWTSQPTTPHGMKLSTSSKPQRSRFAAASMKQRRCQGYRSGRSCSDHRHSAAKPKLATSTRGSSQDRKRTKV